MTKVTRRAVDESRFGLYVWGMPDGKLVADEDGNWLNIPSERDDLNKIIAITNAARYHGITEGEPVFLAGRRRVTDEELEEQKARMAAGLTPDIYDSGALLDELNAKKEHGLL